MIFDSSYRSIADKIFVLDLFVNKYRMSHVRRYLSVFTLTGQNQLNQNHSFDEIRRFRKSLKYKTILKWAKPIILLFYWLEKFINGCYFEKFPIIIEIFTKLSYPKRTKIFGYWTSPFLGKLNMLKILNIFKK